MALSSAPCGFNPLSPSEDQDLLRQALDLIPPAIGPQSTLSITTNRIAIVLMNVGAYELSRLYFQKSIALHKKLFGLACAGMRRLPCRG